VADMGVEVHRQPSRILDQHIYNSRVSGRRM